MCIKASPFLHPWSFRGQLLAAGKLQDFTKTDPAKQIKLSIQTLSRFAQSFHQLLEFRPRLGNMISPWPINDRHVGMKQWYWHKKDCELQLRLSQITLGPLTVAPNFTPMKLLTMWQESNVQNPFYYWVVIQSDFSYLHSIGIGDGIKEYVFCPNKLPCTAWLIYLNLN